MSDSLSTSGCVPSSCHVSVIGLLCPAGCRESGADCGTGGSIARGLRLTRSTPAVRGRGCMPSGAPGTGRQGNGRASRRVVGASSGSRQSSAWGNSQRRRRPARFACSRVRIGNRRRGCAGTSRGAALRAERRGTARVYATGTPGVAPDSAPARGAREGNISEATRIGRPGPPRPCVR